MSQLDKRLFPRLDAKLGNYASYVEGAGAIQDLSAAGVFINEPEPFPVGKSFDFDLHLENEILHCRGVVCRSIPGRGMGIRFVNMPAAAQTRVEKYLNALGVKK